MTDDKFVLTFVVVRDIHEGFPIHFSCLQVVYGVLVSKSLT